MAQPELRPILIGEYANDGTGDTLRDAAVKINANFNDVYAALGIGGNTTYVNSIIGGTGITVNQATGNVTVHNTAPKFDTVSVAGNDSIVSDNLNRTLNVTAGSYIELDTDNQTKTLVITGIDPRVTSPVDWNAALGPTRILNKPAIPAPQVQSDWAQFNSASIDYIKNKPDIQQADWDQSDTNSLGFIKNKPAIPAAQIPSDWLQSNASAPDYIKNKPSIPAPQVQSDWNQTNNTQPDYIKNKPDVTQKQSDWSQTDDTQADFIKNKPTLLQSDWAQADTASIDFIKNKPVIPSDLSQLTDNNNLVIADAKNYTSFYQVGASLTETIYTANTAPLAGIRAVTHASFLDSGTGTLHFQTAEISIIASAPTSGTPVVAKTIFNKMCTTTPFAIFNATWDSMAGRIIITAENINGTAMPTKVTAVEYA